MGKTNFENLRVYQSAEKSADEIWTVVLTWDKFALETIGKQIVRAADSIRANIAEGEGRGSYRDNRRLVKIARGSLQETQHRLRRACLRNLPTKPQVEKLRPMIDKLAPTLNAYLFSIGRKETKDKGQRTKNDEE